MKFRIKGASIREISDYIKLEALTCSEAESVLSTWLSLNGYKKHETCYVDSMGTCSKCHIAVPEGAEHLIKFCPICGAQFSVLTRVK